MIYCTATNYGKNFISHAESAKGSIEGFAGDVWVADDVHDTWVDKVGGVSKTKVEAQAIVNTGRGIEQTAWDNDSRPEDDYDDGGKGYRPGDITLP